ncbi:MGP isoform 4, partial [Pan troglodytes]
SHESMESYELRSENALSLSTSSIGKPVMTTDFANATPWFMDTMLPIIATSGSAEGPNEIGERKKISFFLEAGT